MSRETHRSARRPNAELVVPERVRIAFGIYTQLPIRDGRSRSLQGQGMAARWHRFRVRGLDA